MMQSGDRDPFYAVRDIVESLFVTLHASIRVCDDVIKSGGGSIEAEPSLSAARDTSAAIDVHVKDLVATMKITEENPAHFSYLSNRELDSRRSFINDAQQSLQQHNGQIDRIASHASNAANARRKELLAGSTRVGRDGIASNNANSNRYRDDDNHDRHHNANDEFISQSLMNANNMIDSQNVELENISSILDRLAVISTTVNTQLVDSTAHIGIVGDDVDKASSMMSTAQIKMNKLIKSSDRGRMCCILMLFMLAVGLLFGIVY